LQEKVLSPYLKVSAKDIAARSVDMRKYHLEDVLVKIEDFDKNYECQVYKNDFPFSLFNRRMHGLNKIQKGEILMSYNYGECLADQSGLNEFQGRDSVDLLARMIYSEASIESNKCRRGVAFVALNRRNAGNPKWGNTFESVLLCGEFDGMYTNNARCPVTSSEAWLDSLNIAANLSSQTNPIGNRLYFCAEPSTPPSGAKDVLKIDHTSFYNL
jgi:hypothetical protein